MNGILSIFLNGFHSWKTSLTGIIAAVVYLLHVTHTVEVPANVQSAAVVVALFVYGWISKDATALGTAGTDDNG